MNSVPAFLVTIAVLIAVHEYGHYRVAKACGVKVLRFSLGFGPVLWRRQPTPASTEFVISAIPFGGYVKMLDERGRAPDEGPIPAADLPHAFNRRPLHQRAAVVAAGPLANLLLAVLLYAAAQWHGIEEPQALVGAPPAGSLAAQAGLRAGDRVLATSPVLPGGSDAEPQTGPAEPAWQPVRGYSDLRWAVTRAFLDHQALRLRVQAEEGGAAEPRELLLPLDTLESQDLDAATLQRMGLPGPWQRPVMSTLQPGGPAALAGLQAGDRVLRIDDQPVPDAPALFARIRAALPAPADAAASAPAMRWQIERDGRRLDLLVQPRIADDKGTRVGRIDAGIAAPYSTVLVSDGPLRSLQIGLSRTGENISLTLRMMGRMLVGQASLKNLSGPLTIADAAANSARGGVSVYLAFLAMVSVSLGVLNLLPLPMLDGGHLLYYLFEGLTGRPVSDLWLSWLQRGGMLILLLMMSLALSNDVALRLGH